MVCCCALAGTSACNTCSRRAEYFSTPYKVVAEPYVNNYAYVLKENERISLLEEAIKRLNERIDEILEEEK